MSHKRHFVSEYCRFQVCYCGKPAKHRIGEEIPRDEPCPTCGLIYSQTCRDTHHKAFGGSRHNLTAWVCCACFTHVFGRGCTQCPLTELELTVQLYYEAIREREPGFEPPIPLLCPRCGHHLIVTGPDPANSILFVDCSSCKMSFQLSYSPEA